ncbi:methyl-accepting chemotaxis protein [Desulfobacterales bacterium HSG17]|nr:methyl-accepting chemotaxis protein [Desulfobacterales bacterium HSG17]
MKLGNLKIGTRFGLSFAIVLILMLGIIFYSIKSLESAAQATNKLYKHPFAVSTAVLRIDGDIVRIHRSMKDVALAKNNEQIEAAVSIVSEKEGHVFADFEIIEERFLGDKKQVEEIIQLFKAWKPIRDEVISLMKAEDKDKAAMITKGKGAEHVKKLNEGIQEFLDFANGKAESFVEHAQSSSQRAVIVNYSVSGIMLLISIFLGIIITRSITVPIARVVEVAGAMARGDMTQRLGMDQKDEGGQLSDSLDALAEALKKNLSEVSSISEQVTSAASELSSSSESLSQGAGEQAASLEEVSSTMIEIDAQTKSNAENSENVNKNVKALKEMAENGTKEMENLKTAMKEIDQSGKSIAKIIDVIDDIASQTNLLALNATIEAASAGEAGRGFAVVANEIKELAKQSAQAAKETAEFIENTIKKVETGGEITELTSEALKKIAKGSLEASAMVAEVAASANEQSESIIQVTQALEQVDQVTQANTANAEQTAASAEELNAQSEQLRQILKRFKLGQEDTYTGTAINTENKSFAKGINQPDFQRSLKKTDLSHQNRKSNNEIMIPLSDNEFENY